MSKVLRFNMKVENASPQTIFGILGRFHPNGEWALNRTEWMGKEPRSCAVTRVFSDSVAIGERMRCHIEVTYRPKGYISYTGNTKYDGWTAMILDRASDGTLLDGKGQPLKDGASPVYLPKEVYSDMEYNDLDFGEFIEEVEVDPVLHTTYDRVLQALTDSLHNGISLHGGLTSQFIAPHRMRPLKQIILSNSPTFQAVDGFGTHIYNVPLSTTHLEQALMDKVTDLMCEFIEGKASIKNHSNAEMTFVELSDALVDCEPNEIGMESWFDVLQYYTPIGFLEDLAKRLMAKYAVTVEVVDGKECGLVLRSDPSQRA